MDLCETFETFPPQKQRKLNKDFKSDPEFLANLSSKVEIWKTMQFSSPSQSESKVDETVKEENKSTVCNHAKQLLRLLENGEDCNLMIDETKQSLTVFLKYIYSLLQGNDAETEEENTIKEKGANHGHHLTEELIKSGDEVNILQDQNNPLFKILPPPPNPNPISETLLHLHEQFLGFLVQNESEVNFACSDFECENRGPLLQDSLHLRSKVRQILLKFGNDTNLNSKCNLGQFYPRKCLFLDWLLSSGSEVNSNICKGKVALHSQFKWRLLQFIDLLLLDGSKVNNSVS